MKKPVSTYLPKPLGPYSQGIEAGQFIFLSGQIPFVPRTGELADGGIVRQAEQVLTNLEMILLAAGSSLKQVVRTEVHLSDLSDFDQFIKIYADFFPAQIFPPVSLSKRLGCRKMR
jgi:2-iminobutanoate/2-iminopropanoate deaminase